jgi:hypothetical protein
VKFLCIDCDAQMHYEDREVPGDGTFTAAFSCPRCGHRIALLANPMETQLVGSLGVRIGGRTLEEAPLETIRARMVGREDAFVEPPAEPRGEPPPARPRWSAEAEDRLGRVPSFVRGMVKRLYGEYAAERGIGVITPDVMDRARVDLGLEEM